MHETSPARSACDAAGGRYMNPWKAMGDVFLISRRVGARSQPWRVWAPQHKKQKQSAEGAILWPKLSKTCGFPCILVTQATVQPSHHSIDRPDRPGPSTTRPRPTGRPVHHLPPLGPTLGTRPDGPLSPGPPPGAPFFVFCFLRSLAGSNYPGRPLTERSKALRPSTHG